MRKLTTLLILMVISRQMFAMFPYGRDPRTEAAQWKMHYGETPQRVLLDWDGINNGDIADGAGHAEQNTCCTGRKPRWMCYTTVCLTVSAAAVIAVATCGAIKQCLEENGGNSTGG